MSGNPVKTGDGCATVTGYKLPEPLISQSGSGRRERGEARSQDTGPVALVRRAILQCRGNVPCLVESLRHFSVNEKDEASRCASGVTGL